MSRKRKPRRPSHFKQRDVMRLLRAFEAEQMPQPIIKVTKEGDLIAIPADVPGVDASSRDANPWDDVLTDVPHEKRSARSGGAPAAYASIPMG
jgi:hypothetical protein